MVREGPPQPPPYPAEKARGGTVVLRKPWQRVLFIAGLAIRLLLLLLVVFYLAR